MILDGRRRDCLRPIVVALAFSLGTELFYLVMWGMVLFPAGPLLSKVVWTLTCGVAMGSVVATLTILLVSGRLRGNPAIVASAAILFAVGSFCAVLCSRLDAVLNYFGGPDNTGLFILSGVLPALAGGVLYGWLLYGKSGQSVLIRLGI